MSSRINNLEVGYSTQHPLMMIPKDKLPKRPFDQHLPSPTTEKNKIIAMNRDGNKAEIQQASNFIAQCEGSESQENDENNTSDKSTLITAAGALTKEGLYRLTKKGLLKPNPYMVALSLLGVDFEEDGDALKKGAVAALSVVVCQYFIKRVVSPFFSVPAGEMTKKLGIVKPKLYAGETFTGKSDLAEDKEIQKPKFDVMSVADEDTNLINRYQNHNKQA